MKLISNRIIVKVGTSTLTNELGKSNLRSFDRLACVLSDVQNMGYEVILVSSGAIAVGANKLNMASRPTEMRFKQAAAAVGQCSNMYLYDKFFSGYDKTIGQILLNAEDIEQEEKRENLTNTFNAMLEMGVIPIVNFPPWWPFCVEPVCWLFSPISTGFMIVTPVCTRTPN